MCGENEGTWEGKISGEGSSPRVRGKRLGGVTVAALTGLIPACAGKTQVEAVPTLLPQAHPRVCGENKRRRLRLRLFQGSSPRVRGKRDNPRSRGSLRRLIPACAGKTGREPTDPPRSRAHPRVCGENVREPFRKDSAMGSSPRVRGKPFLYRDPLGRRRLIPACAGKTHRSPRARVCAWAHPRVCGENRIVRAVVS